MRFFEFAGDDNLEKFIIVLKNFIGRASSKKTPAKLNWAGLQQVAKKSGIDLVTDYETFKSMYDSTPALQSLVKNFNDRGIELNVPGAPEEPAEKEPAQGGQTSQDAVDQAAASAAPQQLAAQA
jgi:hypothetical protein